MNDYLNDEFIQAVRAGYNIWIPAGEDPILYEDMSEKHIKIV